MTDLEASRNRRESGCLMGAYCLANGEDCASVLLVDLGWGRNGFHLLQCAACGRQVHVAERRPDSEVNSLGRISQGSGQEAGKP